LGNYLCRAFLCFTFLSLLSGFALAGGDEGVSIDKPLAKLKSISIDELSIRFVAKSNGCTRAQDFRLVIVKDELSIFRERKDRCRKMPEWASFSLSLDYTGDEPLLRVLNPLVTMPRRAAM